MTPTDRLGRLGDAVLTRDPPTRFMLGLWLTSVITYVLYCGVLQAQVELGLTPASAAQRLYAGALVINALFYGLMRSGLAKKVPFDPGLGFTQLLVGIAFFWAAYAVSGPAAGATLMVMSSHMVYSLFSMSPKRVIKLGVGSLVALGLVMLACGHLMPDRYPANVQIVGFLYAGVVILLIARLAKPVTAMNEKLRSQHKELQAALARVQELATRDDLTRLYNRRHLTELMEIARQQHVRHLWPCCMALIDVDFFKNVNDTHGHHAGDEVLRAVGAQARETFRESDLVGRWGGEEFLVLFPNTAQDKAEQALQRLRERLAATAFDGVADGLRVTFSAGLVRLAKGESIADCVDRADKAMYQAKLNGRNRTVCEMATSVASAA